MYALKIAQQTVHQWDNYDKFRVVAVEGDCEPDDVTMARALIGLTLKVELLTIDNTLLNRCLKNLEEKRPSLKKLCKKEQKRLLDGPPTYHGEDFC